MDVRELTCQELVDLVTDYLDEALPPSERARFEAHIADCPYCDAYLDQMRRTIRMVGMQRETTIAPAAEVELLRRFRTWKQG
ncbi:MAG: zf-HC2 domain-containing protein [Chloroflexota bacterium]|nr:zf-HC2 domain-containing protein [Chloroflexota bacterium]